jgi:hypothetical protein
MYKDCADDAIAMEKMHQIRCKKQIISIPIRRERHPQQKWDGRIFTIFLR